MALIKLHRANALPDSVDSTHDGIWYIKEDGIISFEIVMVKGGIPHFLSGNKISYRTSNMCYTNSTGAPDYLILQKPLTSFCESYSSINEGEVVTIINSRDVDISISPSHRAAFIIDDGQPADITKIQAHEWIKVLITSGGENLRILGRGFTLDPSCIFYKIGAQPAFGGISGYRNLSNTLFNSRDRSPGYIYECKTTLIIYTRLSVKYGDLRMQIGTGIWDHPILNQGGLSVGHDFIIMDINYTLEFTDSPRQAFLNGTITYGDNIRATSSIIINPAGRDITAIGNQFLSIQFRSDVANSTNTIKLQRHSIKRVM